MLRWTSLPNRKMVFILAWTGEDADHGYVGWRVKWICWERWR